jgi:glyoxylase-like metal-dependent hydrolase (beta-lactamase superfamily II)
MKVIPISVGTFQVNCYLAAAPNHQALVIDPGDDAGIIAVTVRQNKLTVAGYLITHGHMDHVSGLAEMTRTFPAPVSIHPLDESWAFSHLNQALPYYDSPERPTKIERLLADGQHYEDAGLRYEIIATPGHSPGGVCFYFPDEKVIFTGDTLFLGTIGRTDLDGSDEKLMKKSLARLAKLPDDTAVYPGHGPETTIGQEKRTNPFMQF